jgi:hypothetical protein
MASTCSVMSSVLSGTTCKAVKVRTPKAQS